jgi:hypothetical protein
MTVAIRQFVSLVRRVKEMEHRMHCVQCSFNENATVVRNHSLYVSGDWEFYTCEVCGNTQGFKVR